MIQCTSLACLNVVAKKQEVKDYLHLMPYTEATPFQTSGLVVSNHKNVTLFLCTSEVFFLILQVYNTTNSNTTEQDVMLLCRLQYMKLAGI